MTKSNWTEKRIIEREERFLKNALNMSVYTSFIYRFLIGGYKLMPFKRAVCHTLRALPVSHSKFYRDMKFQGPFEVRTSKGTVFQSYHYGGTIENETFWNGLFVTWEDHTGWIWEELCAISEVIVDIGANNGIYSLTAKAINPKAQVYAFEPSAQTFPRLMSNNTLNGFDIRCEYCALSNIDGEQILYDDLNPNQTSASLSAKKNKEWDLYKGQLNEYKVKTLRLSTYIEEMKLERIDLIKIDIEMHEPEAIEGLGDYLTKFNPIVIIEVLSEEVATKLNGLIDDQHLIFHLTGASGCVAAERFSVVPGMWNYVFFHKNREAHVRQHTSLFNCLRH